MSLDPRQFDNFNGRPSGRSWLAGVLNFLGAVISLTVFALFVLWLLLTPTH